MSGGSAACRKLGRTHPGLIEDRCRPARARHRVLSSVPRIRDVVLRDRVRRPRPLQLLTACPPLSLTTRSSDLRSTRVARPPTRLTAPAPRPHTFGARCRRHQAGLPTHVLRPRPRLLAPCMHRGFDSLAFHGARCGCQRLCSWGDGGPWLKEKCDQPCAGQSPCSWGCTAPQLQPKS